MASDQHFSLKCFQENAFVSKILPKFAGLFWPKLLIIFLKWTVLENSYIVTCVVCDF